MVLTAAGDSPLLHTPPPPLTTTALPRGAGREPCGAKWPLKDVKFFIKLWVFQLREFTLDLAPTPSPSLSFSLLAPHSQVSLVPLLEIYLNYEANNAVETAHLPQPQTHCQFLVGGVFETLECEQTGLSWLRRGCG